MSIDNLLQHLNKVQRTGKGKWRACCPAHPDKSPSLALLELDDGRVLIHCFAGCGAAEILESIGLNFSALFPPAINSNFLPKLSNRWNARDVLNGLAFEVLIAWNISKNIASGATPTNEEVNRLLLCVSRINNGLGMINE